MLKHVHNTLARRNNKTSQQQSSRPPSPSPSTLSSCSSVSSGSIFYASTPNASAYDALTLSPGSSSVSSGYSSTWSSNTHGTTSGSSLGRRRTSISLSTKGGDTDSTAGRVVHHAGSIGLSLGVGAGSRLSISSIGSSIDGSVNGSINCAGIQRQGNVVPLRVYTDNGALRPDILFKTVPVTQSTTCRQIIGLVLSKCKIRYRDPRLYGLAMELKIRAPNGADVETAVPLDDGAYPLRLQECYPRGQARFTLKMNTGDGKLVKVHDETELLGWQYKSILISEKTTTGELIDILTRFTPPNIVGVGAGVGRQKVLQCRGTRFELQLQVNEAWTQTLRPSDPVISTLQSSSVNNSTKLILCRERPPLPPRPASTISLYENVFSNISPTSSIASSSDSSSYSMPESDASTPRPRQGPCPNCNHEYWRRRRSHSLSLSSGDSGSSNFAEEDEDALLLQAFELFNLSQVGRQNSASTNQVSNVNANDRRNLTRSYSNGLRYEFFV